MRRVLVLFARAESGATAIEYALIATFIALVVITALTSVGLALSDVFGSVAGSI
jgi:pilus assembly protein Flp/PilA